jgi:hypothetical protein
MSEANKGHHPRKPPRTPATSIRSIEPTCAPPGATARIRGKGFGPGHLRVTVGGARARIVRASGNEVRFQLPHTAPQGPVEVRAINPGGHVGKIPWVVAAPGACVLLGGNPASPALDAIVDIDGGHHLRPEEISEGEGGLKIARTSFEIWLEDGATVGQVNALLESIAARIVSSLDDVPALVVRIPDPGSLVALEALIGSVQSNPIVQDVFEALIPEPGGLPLGYTDPPTANDLRFNQHQIAVRAPAAWNALGARVNTPIVGMTDYFDRGPPAFIFDIDGLSGDFPLHLDPTPDGDHGYLVLSPIAAGHKDAAPLGGLAAGPITLHVVNAIAPTDGLNDENKLLQIVKTSGGPVVWNRSLIGGSPDPVECDRRAEAWIRKVRLAGLEEKFLLVQCAGNVGQGPAGNDAAVDNKYNAAALRDLDVRNLTNTLVVENRRNSPGAIPGTYLPGELQPGLPEFNRGAAKVGGNLSAIGSFIFSHSGNSSQMQPLDNGGCSSATPQVSGLAAYLLSIDKDLSAPELKTILIETARDLGDGAPVIDAYAATLALDEDVNDPVQASVRMAILDAADDSFPDKKFYEDDIARFLDKFDAGLGDADHSRFDLNGDGVTGATGLLASGLDRVDLDGSRGASPYTEVLQTIEGRSVRFDERSSSDLDVLCYSAYSGLYTGDPIERARKLVLRCANRVEIAVEGVPQTLEPGVPAILQVIIQAPDADGNLVALPHAPLNFFVRAGGQIRFEEPDGTVTVVQPGQQGLADTGQAGFVALEVLRLPDSPQIDVGLAVLDPTGAETPLAEKTLRIPEECPPPGPQGSFQAFDSLAAPAADETCEEPPATLEICPADLECSVGTRGGVFCSDAIFRSFNEFVDAPASVSGSAGGCNSSVGAQASLGVTPFSISVSASASMSVGKQSPEFFVSFVEASAGGDASFRILSGSYRAVCSGDASLGPISIHCPFDTVLGPGTYNLRTGASVGWDLSCGSGCPESDARSATLLLQPVE